MIPPIFVINLTVDIERKQHMQALGKKHNLSMNFIEAVDGKTLTKAQKATYSKTDAIKNLNREMSAGEIACGLSHRLIYQKMVDNDIEVALVLEDDAWFDSQLLGLLSQLNYLDEDWELLLLGYHKQTAPRSFWYKKKIKDNIIRRTAGIVAGTHGYCITNNGAKKMLKHTKKISKPIDNYIGNSEYSNLYVLQNCVVLLDNKLHLLSAIGDDREDNCQENYSKFKLFFVTRKNLKAFLVLRILYRLIFNIKRSIKNIFLFVKPIRRYVVGMNLDGLIKK